MKIKKMGELAYVLAILILSLGTVLCAKADLGMSMIAALSFGLKPFFGGYIGLAEYAVQATVLAVFCIVMQRFRWKYLFSFLTALFYGGALILCQWIFASFTPSSLTVRILMYAVGTALVALAVVLFLRTYLPIEIYELFVKGMTVKFGMSITVAKWIFDFAMLLLAVLTALTVHFFIGKGYQNGLSGLFSSLKAGGLGIGTVITTLVTGPLVSLFGKILDKFLVFDPLFPKFKTFLGDDVI